MGVNPQALLPPNYLGTRLLAAESNAPPTLPALVYQIRCWAKRSAQHQRYLVRGAVGSRFQPAATRCNLQRCTAEQTQASSQSGTISVLADI